MDLSFFMTLAVFFVMNVLAGCSPDESTNVEPSGSPQSAVSSGDGELEPTPSAEGATDVVLGQRPKKIDIALPEGPPTGDPVEPGTWVLSVNIELDNGAIVSNRHACTVSLEGEKVTIRLDRSSEAPLVGTLRDGRLEVDARQGKATYSLEGQVTGPGRLAGRIAPGQPLEGVAVLDGRWELRRVK